MPFPSDTPTSSEEGGHWESGGASAPLWTPRSGQALQPRVNGTCSCTRMLPAGAQRGDSEPASSHTPPPAQPEVHSTKQEHSTQERGIPNKLSRGCSWHRQRENPTGLSWPLCPSSLCPLRLPQRREREGPPALQCPSPKSIRREKPQISPFGPQDAGDREGGPWGH